MNDPIATLLRASVHQFIGRLGRDPETRFLDSGKSVTNVNIGINHLADRDQSDWIKLEVWGEQGQAFADQCRKGELVHVIGRVKTDRWTNSAGEEQMMLCCRVEQWKRMPPAGAGQAPAPAAPAPAVAPAPAAAHPAHLAAAGWAPNPANGTVAAQGVWNSPQQAQAPDHDGIPF